MNTRQAIQPSNTPAVLCISPSAYGTRFSAGLSDGFRSFRLDNCFTTHVPILPYDCGIAVLDQLDDRYIAFVTQRKVSGAKGPNVVVFWDAFSDTEVTSYNLFEPILGVRVRHEYLAVILAQRTLVLQYQKIFPDPTVAPPQGNESAAEGDDVPEDELQIGPNVLHSLHRTGRNPYALAAIVKDLLVLPTETVGQLQLISLVRDGSHVKRVLRAHNSSVRALALSPDETLLATASEQGTLIRVFNTQSLHQIAEFRRGVDHAVIYSLALSPGARWVAATSDKGTLHVFDLRPPDAAAVAREREAQARSPPHRRAPSFAGGGRRVSAGADALSGISGDSGGRPFPAPSTALGAGTSHGSGSVQEYYGLRAPPALSTSPPTAPRDSALSAVTAALRASSLAPRIFKDVRSVASAPFKLGNDPPHWQGAPAFKWTTAPDGSRKRVALPVPPRPGDPSGRPPKGVLMFKLQHRNGASVEPDEDEAGATIYVIGGGAEHRWEEFQLGRDGAATPGGWGLLNQGFRRYLTRQFDV